MVFEFSDALVGAAIAIVGGIAGGLTPLLVAWWYRPKLLIDFQGDENNTVEVRQTIKDSKTEEVIFVRARVQNEGHQRAKSCLVFLTALYELRADGSLHRVLKDSKVLQWAGGTLSPLDVAQGVEFYVDLLRVSKEKPGWGMIHGLFTHQLKLQDYSGTYQFHLMVSGDNASPSRCEINVEYKQDWHSLRTWRVK
jgi:hypothetical protein